jgi:hypothetical protein
MLLEAYYGPEVVIDSTLDYRSENREKREEDC